jgi:hypothetical protein
MASVVTDRDVPSMLTRRALEPADVDCALTSALDAPAASEATVPSIVTPDVSTAVGLDPQAADQKAEKAMADKKRDCCRRM